VAGLRRYGVTLVLAVLVGGYALATLPYLDRFPLVGRDEAQIAAAAYKLAHDGVYGQDLYTGYYRSERYVYEFMPLHPLLLALGFRLAGVGVWQARVVSVLCGLATLLLTYELGRRLYDARVGVLAAAALCALRFSLDPRASGVPLLDLGRIVRYDILVPVFVLASVLCFLAAHRRDRRLGYLGTGLLAGLATLSHVYGAFILAVLVGALLWEQGREALRRPPAWLIMAGWLLALLPWGLYAIRDPAAYYGQTLVDQAVGQFDLIDPAFYWNNLARERLRYRTLFDGDGSTLLRPRVGLWLVFLGVATTNACLWARGRRHDLSLPDRMLLLGVPVLGGLMALLLSHKRYSYILLVLPFLALQVAYGWTAAWRWASARARPLRVAGAALLLAACVEAGIGIGGSLAAGRSASPYDHLTRAIARHLPASARILAVHIYWFGLAAYDLRSLDLPFRFSNPGYFEPRALSMEEALRAIAPDYVLIDPLIERHILHPIRAAEDATLERQKRDFTEAVRVHCRDRVATVGGPEDADYGPVDVLRCHWPSFDAMSSARDGARGGH
jgi:4-amino-4-deoxy-L-arabinose transferase-like glycosyltransferase